MAACLWYVLVLPAVFIPALAGPYIPCVARRFDTCEGQHAARVEGAVKEGFGEEFFNKTCLSIQALINCATTECEGKAWHATDDYVILQFQFSRLAGVCGGEVSTHSCSKEVGEKCMKKMAEAMETGDFCVYYSVYAKCLVAELPACDEYIATHFAKEMKRQLLRNLPIAVGLKRMRMCEEWSGDLLE